MRFDVDENFSFKKANESTKECQFSSNHPPQHHHHYFYLLVREKIR
jgi:hypothetical protein